MDRDHLDARQAAFDTHSNGPGDRPVMRARFEHNGSPRYLLYAIKRFGFDHDHGFHLDVDLVTDELESGMETVRHRLDEGDTDLVDTDCVTWSSATGTRRASTACTGCSITCSPSPVRCHRRRGDPRRDLSPRPVTRFSI